MTDERVDIPEGEGALMIMMADMQNESDQRYKSLSERLERLERQGKVMGILDNPERLMAILMVAYVASMIIPSLFGWVNKCEQ